VPERRVRIPASPALLRKRTHTLWRAAMRGCSIVAMAKCPLTQSQFLAKAEPLEVAINGQKMLAEVKSFSTGSFGWYLTGKTIVTVDGKPVSVQIGLNLTLVGSKDAER
jgi:hypothetical protein